jgi:hypothetical protein
MSSTIQFYHFDTAQRDNLTDDPFQCQLTLYNSLRRVKKIFLKSCEMPIGFFNIQKSIAFSFLRSTNDFRESLSFLSQNRISIYSYTDSAINNYYSTSASRSSTFRDVNGVNISSFNTSPNPDLQLDVLNSSNSDYKIFTVDIPAGNYTIQSLTAYINMGIKAIFDKFFLTKGPDPNYIYPKLTMITVNDKGTFPVGYVQFNFNSVCMCILDNDSNKYLGFLPNQCNTTKTTIKATSLWNMYPDLCIYMYLESIPQTNSHFKNNLVSFKIPISSGYQSIEYNADNLNFAQYIEITDENFILNSIKLKIYDRNNNLLTNNGFDFTFTLAVETGNSMSNTIQFYHFDTAQRDNLSDNSFQCQLTLYNSLRRVKKIFLKSCELPIGYFNIRTPQYFEFAMSFYQEFDSFDADKLTVYGYRPTWSTSYNTPSEDSDSNYTRTHADTRPYEEWTDEQKDLLKFSICVVPGNYTIDSLIKYINDAISRIISIYTVSADFYPNFTASLSILRVASKGQFPVGYLKFTSNEQFLYILPTELNYKYLGFTSYKNNQQIKQKGIYTIQSLRLWNIYPDLSIYIHFENIPQTNSHFKNNLVSFKIPISAGYQSIEYNADNANFAQYIENTDVNFILNSIKLKIYDRNNNLLTNNGFDFTFTLGIEYFN